MEVFEFGNGRKEVTVVGGVHGDEPAGPTAIKRALKYDFDYNCSVKYIIANEVALSQNTRFVECDMNRKFPGNINSDLLEERLAAKVMDEISDSHAVLTIHTSHSAPPPFLMFEHLNPATARTILGLSPRYAARSREAPEGMSLEYANHRTVNIEAGKQGSKTAVDNAENAILRFLDVHGAIDNGIHIELEKTAIFEVQKKLEKGDDPHLHYHNFEFVSEGNVIAEDEEYRHIAGENGVIPVLAGMSGYTDIYGLIAQFSGFLKPYKSDGFCVENGRNQDYQNSILSR